MVPAPLSNDRSMRLLIDLARERLRVNFGDKLTGAVVALVLEALLLLVLLSIGEMRQPHKDVPMTSITFDAKEATKKPPPEKAAAAKPRAMSPQQEPTTRTAEVATPQPAAIIPVSPQQMKSFDLANLAKPAAPKAPYGPAFAPTFGDSQRVGTAPNGQPMYGASWYPHEPTHEQMAGYLSTAQPGWALITCKTVADYRVEDCVGLDEYPENSHLIESVIAASWQFRVRPPRVNGALQVGDWVRIRFTYEEVAKRSYGGPSGN